jgi:hypothetical protein
MGFRRVESVLLGAAVTIGLLGAYALWVELTDAVKRGRG